jgi:hypothetical protein
MYTSDTLTSIAPALAAARANIGSLVKDTIAKGEKFSYAYATLDQLIELVTPPLLEQGIVLHQDVGGSYDHATQVEVVSVKSRLQHVSGEFIESSPIVSLVEEARGLSLMQSAGKNITYSRRYQLQSLLGIAAEVDDDAKKEPAPENKDKWNKLAQVRSQYESKDYPPREERGPTPMEDDFLP